MNHSDHIDLLRPGIPQPGGVWADLGAGAGAFTLALAELVGPQAQIYAVDKDQGALRRLSRSVNEHYPALTLHTVGGDFSKSLDLPPLDGLVMANSLHFLQNKEVSLRQIRDYLRPGGRLILVEYDTDRGNYWVPHPLSYERWEKLADRVGLVNTRRLATKPSSFLGRFFSAVSFRA